jgi:hypothetical protein
MPSQYGYPPPYPGHYQPQPIYVTQQVQVAPAYLGAPKSMVASLLLTFFFGPFGLFYASIVGGIVMLIVTFVAAALTLGFSVLVTWPICMIWAAIATSNYNTRLAARPGTFSQTGR